MPNPFPDRVLRRLENCKEQTVGFGKGFAVDLSRHTMCPDCGRLFGRGRRIPVHDDQGERCPGSEQCPRNPATDRRRLWNGQPNPHLDADGKQKLRCRWDRFGYACCSVVGVRLVVYRVEGKATVYEGGDVHAVCKMHRTHRPAWKYLHRTAAEDFDWAATGEPK